MEKIVFKKVYLEDTGRPKSKLVPFWQYLVLYRLLHFAFFLINYAKENKLLHSICFPPPKKSL